MALKPTCLLFMLVIVSLLGDGRKARLTNGRFWNGWLPTSKGKSYAVDIMEIENTSTSKAKYATPLVLALLFLVVLAASVAGTYEWQHRMVDDLNVQVAGLNARVRTLNRPTTNQNQVKFMRTVGFPYDLKSTTITTNLGVPADMEAVQVRSSGNNRGSEQIFTDKFNDEMARFTLSYPQFAPNGDNEISILAISPSWLSSSNEQETFLGYGGVEPQVDLQSPASKTQYVRGLSTLTKSCINDPTTGFQTKDKTFSICYKLVTDKYGGPSWVLLRGYAEVQGEPLILTGIVVLDDHYNVLNPSVSGVRLQSTADAEKELINALAQTTVTAGDRTH